MTVHMNRFLSDQVFAYFNMAVSLVKTGPHDD